MDKFNLTFKGEILPGQDLAEVKVRFAEVLSIEDSDRVDLFFSGKKVALRRDVDKRTAEAFYTKMYRTGAVVELERIEKEPATSTPEPKVGMDREFHSGSSGNVEQSWPIRSPSPQKPPAAFTGNKRGNALLLAEELEREKAKEVAAALDTKKRVAKQAAKKKATEKAAKLHAEQKRKYEEEVALAKEKETQRIKAQEQAARKKAAEEAARKKAAEEAARKKAAEEAARKKAAEEAARKKAAEEAARKKAAEEAARKKAAEEAARKKALVVAAKKKAAKESAKEKALKLAAKKEADDKAARLRTELAEQKRKHAEEAARARADEKRIEDELRALASVQQAEDAAQAAELKQKQQEEEKEKSRQQTARVRREKQVQERAAKLRVEEQKQEQAALDRAAEGSARLEKLQKLSRARETLPPKTTREPAAGVPRRQPGAPNLFSLKPFRNTAEIRQRAEKSRQLMKSMYIISVATLLALLILGTFYTLLPVPFKATAGPDAIAVDPHSGLIILAGNELFALDRSGVDSNRYSLMEFGIDARVTLLGFDSAGQLLIQALEEPADGMDPNTGIPDIATMRTLRCRFETWECLPYEQDFSDKPISSFVVDSRTGESYVASPVEGLLIKLARDGSLKSQVKISMPETATLVLREGLLYMNSAAGPAVSIFRPDDKGFGEQLDEVLLLPPPALAKEQTQIDAILWAGDSWWVTMANPETRNTGLYRFDPKWNFISTVSLIENSHPEQLVQWADKILVLDSEQLAIQRFNSQAAVEAPLVPEALRSYVENTQHSRVLSQQLWNTSLGFLALMGIGSYLFGRLHQLRSLVYRKDKVRGAEPIDDQEKLIRWIDPESSRSSSYKRIFLAYAILCLSLLALIFFLALPTAVMLATLLLFAGPGIAFSLFQRSQIGHIGVLKDQLILVDQYNMYHVGSGARVHYRNNFLLLDDIVVFIGTRKLPVFSTTQLAEEVVPMALAGVKVDKKTVAIKLIQSSHALAKGTYACAACVMAAIMCLLLY